MSFLSTLGINSAQTLLSAVLTLAVCIVAIRLIMKVVDKLLDTVPRFDPTLRGFTRSAVNILLWVLAVIIVANALGINTSSLVALVSVVGIALSLSVQNVLANLFSGLTLLITKPFVAGEFVEAAGKSGVIKTVGLFYTQMCTLDNVALSIPNSDLTASTVSNYSREPQRRVDRVFTVDYAAEPEKVKAAILAAVAQDERILSDPAPFVGLLEYKSSTVDYVARVWVNNPDYWGVYFALNENVRKAFAENGIAFSYEHMNVHLIGKE